MALRDAAETISSAMTLESRFDVIGEQVARPELRMKLGEGRPRSPSTASSSDPSPTCGRGGTGIGPSLARSIVRWHGGELDVLPGAPTGFRMTLPQAPKPNGPDVDEDPVSPPTRS